MLYVALMGALTPVSTLTEVNFEKLSATFIPINRVVYDQRGCRIAVRYEYFVVIIPV